MPRTVKVAVVGTGLAGLTAAHLLTKECDRDDVKFEVHLFEKASSIGMDSSSISIARPAAEHDWRIDVPMRSFQGGYYPNLIALYRSLGVQIRQADFSYSFSSLAFPTATRTRRTITTTMIYNGASGRDGVGKPSYLRPSTGKKQHAIYTLGLELWSSVVFVHMTLQVVICFLITLYHSLPFRRAKSIGSVTLRQWAAEVTPTGYLSRLVGLDTAWKGYVQTILVPIVSAVCTAPESNVMDHPMEEILDYVWLTFGTHHYVVLGGVRSVVAHLTENLEHFHLASPIVSIKPDPQDTRCVTITCLSDGKAEEHSGFHHVVMATQASGAVPILNTYLEALGTKFDHRKAEISKQLQCLKTFEYMPAMVVNHTDGSLLPDNEDDIRDLNLITFVPNTNIPESKETSPLCVSPSYTMATHILPTPKYYPVNQPTVYQTTNPIIPPKKDSILSVARLERAVVTMDSKRALESLCVEGPAKWWQCPYQAETRLGELQGALSMTEPNAPGIWICGSYAHLGIPLLEGCVVSARNVVEQGILRREGLNWTEEPWVAS